MTPWIPARTRGLGLLAAAAVVGLVVSGCTFHPGQAAVVNGSQISQGNVDDLVSAGCGFFQAQREQSGGAAPSTSTAYLRNVFVNSLVSFKLVDDVAKQMHITVSPAVVAQDMQGQTPQMPAGISDHDKELLTTFFRDSTRSSVQEATIGAHLKDPSVTTATHVTTATIAAGQKYVHDYSLKQAVAVNPAYGTWQHGQVVDTDGSLSAAQSQAAHAWLTMRANNAQSVAGLPSSQVCG